MSKEVEDLSKTPGEALQHNGIYVLMDEISSESIKPVIEWLLYENHVVSSKKRELLLMVSSSGGDLASAFALIDTMNSSSIPIKTVGLGQIASCGLLIFMNGHRGRRILTPNTSIMSHQFSWYNEGKLHELFATIREYELTHQRMIEHYRRCTGLSDEKIREVLLPAQDRWLSAQEALENNICDLVSTHTETKQSRK
jgi:ATP-dependent Clp protease protease subunit